MNAPLPQLEVTDIDFTELDGETLLKIAQKSSAELERRSESFEMRGFHAHQKRGVCNWGLPRDPSPVDP